MPEKLHHSVNSARQSWLQQLLVLAMLLALVFAYMPLKLIFFFTAVMSEISKAFLVSLLWEISAVLHMVFSSVVDKSGANFWFIQKLTVVTRASETSQMGG